MPRFRRKTHFHGRLSVKATFFLDACVVHAILMLIVFVGVFVFHPQGYVLATFVLLATAMFGVAPRVAHRSAPKEA